MRTIYRDNYTPQLGDYHDRLIIDGAQEKKWLFDCDGVYTEMDGAEVVNEKGDSTTKAISQKLFTDETNSLAQGITDEANTRSEADRAIWEEIEEIEAASDVTDIVGTHADLEAYDTSKLKDNDIIKVLEDETQDGQITYYRWDKDTSTFSLIGAIGPYYTQAQADAKFQDKLTAGANITIDANNEISATDTTYSNFVGTDGQDDGTAGLVPAPATTDTGKFLSSDGTWEIAAPALYNTYGQNTDAAMTQKATTDLVYTAGDPKKINIGDNNNIGGNNSIIIGTKNSGGLASYGDDIIVIGQNAGANHKGNIAIGGGSSTNDSALAWGDDCIAIGHGAYASGDRGCAIGKAMTGKNGLAIGGSGWYARPSADGDSYGQAIKIGLSGSAVYRAIAIGLGASASGDTNYGTVAIGDNAVVDVQSGVALGSFAKPRAKGVVDVGISSNSASTYDTAGYNNTRYRLISGVHDGEQLHDAATVSQAVGTTETYTIADTDWVALSGANPYTYSVDVTAATTIGANTICELFNDDAVTFATYGFAIGAINSQTVTIYSVGAPTSSVTLKINYKG